MLAQTAARTRKPLTHADMTQGLVTFADVSPAWLGCTEADVSVQAVKQALGEQKVRIAV